ncbi:MAG TPA: MFS transporter [Candidatus Brocadiaceae bacterium]
MQGVFKIVTIIQFLIYLSNGLFAPAWYKILLERGGSIDQFGFLFGLVALGSVFSAYIASWFSDKFEPLGVLSAAISLQGLVMLLYIPVQNLYGVYVLQILYGMLSAALITLQQILIKKYSAGHTSIGLHNSIIQVAVGVAMISSGFVVTQIGTASMIITAAIILVGASIYTHFWK